MIKQILFLMTVVLISHLSISHNEVDISVQENAPMLRYEPVRCRWTQYYFGVDLKVCTISRPVSLLARHLIFALGQQSKAGTFPEHSKNI